MVIKLPKEEKNYHLNYHLNPEGFLGLVFFSCVTTSYVNIEITFM